MMNNVINLHEIKSPFGTIDPDLRLVFIKFSLYEDEGFCFYFERGLNNRLYEEKDIENHSLITNHFVIMLNYKKEICDRFIMSIEGNEDAAYWIVDDMVCFRYGESYMLSIRTE